MIESQGYIICRGAHHIPQQMIRSDGSGVTDAGDMDQITVFEDIVAAEACIKRVLARIPGKEGLHIMLGKWTLKIVEP
jgi:hypothetical protein